MTTSTDTLPSFPSSRAPYDRLIDIVQALSLARDVDRIMAIVRTAARQLTDADGATFVLRDGDLCYYADEDAIEPLWKGRRFQLTACISGWCMIHKQPAMIEDIYADERVPIDTYRPTFVKSLVMVPIRASDPIGAIGTYWSEPSRPTPDRLHLLQALADSTSVALENAQTLQQLENRVFDRTRELELANRELDAFAYSVSHDLRAPLRAINGFAQALAEDCSAMLDDVGRSHLNRIEAAARRMELLIEDLLGLSKIARAEVSRSPIDVTEIARGVVDELRRDNGERSVEVHLHPDMTTTADGGLVRIALQNLIGNAFKYTAKTPSARVEVGCERTDVNDVFFVRDNGAGFDMQYANKLFGCFQRLHSQSEFPGTGIGLATVQRIVHRHGGTISAEASPGAGATFRFTLRPDRHPTVLPASSHE